MTVFSIFLCSISMCVAALPDSWVIYMCGQKFISTQYGHDSQVKYGFTGLITAMLRIAGPPVPGWLLYLNLPFAKK